MGIEGGGRRENYSWDELPLDLERVLLEKREEIDAIDQQLILLLAKRFQVTSEVGAIKRDHSLPVMDGGREVAVLANRCQTAESVGMDADFCKGLFSGILQESRRRQQEQLDE